MAKKTWANMTEEEKDVIRSKRKESIAKKASETREAFKALEDELNKLNASDKVLDLVDKIKVNVGVTKSTTSRSTNLVKIFGSDTPEVGQVATYLEIGVRGPKGERIKSGETLKEFVLRTGDADYICDANTITSIVWLLNKAGHDVVNDKNNARVIYKGRK